jgi:predicted pyridoxine 5'-phosphate oxidase superfamily flavin-nucleotide-binding protein
MIEASPFAVLATAGPGGLDASPRGDPPGFVIDAGRQHPAAARARGNNRIDSLRNILDDPRVALLFLIPGAGETLRVNGSAQITRGPDLLQRFAMEGKLPHCVLVIRVESCFSSAREPSAVQAVAGPMPRPARRAHTRHHAAGADGGGHRRRQVRPRTA